VHVQRAPGPLRIAYLVNQYPKVSHTFVRREIEALERLGAQVARYAVRGWDADLVDDLDRRERERTRYLLRGGVLPLLASLFAVAVSRSARWLAALRLAWRASRADRGLARQMAYLAEACVLLRALRRDPVDQLHAHFGTNGAQVAMLCRVLGGPPFSFTVHGPEEFDRVAQLDLPAKAQHANAIVAISSFARSQLWRWCRAADRDKVHVVRCGLDRTFFDMAPTPPAIAPRLLCIGRLNEQKGTFVLIEAARRLAAEGIPFELVLAGDGELRAEVEAAIASHGIERHVRITGWIDGGQVRAELLAARALVLTSFAEGLPVVLMEAMACARPVLATWVAGIPELVRDGEHGWLFPPGDVPAVVAAMRACLQASPAQLEAMGTAGREWVRQRHDVDVEAGRLLALWRGIAERRAGEWSGVTAQSYRR
jgi:colanic acid/amylovoran biosynthesis glycosyltransferase